MPPHISWLWLLLLPQLTCTIPLPQDLNHDQRMAMDEWQQKLPAPAHSRTDRKQPSIIFEESFKDRNDHSQDRDRVMERSQIVARNTTFFIIGVMLLVIVSLLFGHFYYEWRSKCVR
uniref:Uncharacterized protein n=1 Tax=Plectus sambesii TaxID=2011161 RepID=A0A914X2E1_9BILA